MDDIVEDALAAAEEREVDDADSGAFGPLRVAVVGVGSDGRARLAGFGGQFDDRQVHLGTAPVDAEGTGTVRAYPGGTRRLDLADVDVLFATGHVRSPADCDRLRDVARTAGEEAVTVAVPTVASDAVVDGVADLAPSYDATVPLSAARAADAWDRRDSAAGRPGGTRSRPEANRADDRDPIDCVAGTCCVALVETLFVEPLRALMPHVDVFSLLRDGGTTAACLGTARADAGPAAGAQAALDRTFAPGDSKKADAIVTHVTAGADITLATAQELRSAVERLAPTDPGEGTHYLGVKPTDDEGSPIRVVVFLVGCS